MRIVLIVAALCFHQQALALTIGAGTPDGTYYQIAKDIEQVAEKDGIPIEVIQTTGSFDNINLLGSGKVDLAILQVDALKFASEVLQARAGMNVLEQVKVVLNLYLEEIHVIAKNENIRFLEQLDGKKVAVGPESSGSALTASPITMTDVPMQLRYQCLASSEKTMSSRTLQSGTAMTLLMPYGCFFMSMTRSSDLPSAVT
jgi:TRAP transporter TAXI family solute receptor